MGVASALGAYELRLMGKAAKLHEAQRISHEVYFESGETHYKGHEFSFTRASDIDSNGLELK